MAAGGSFVAAMRPFQPMLAAMSAVLRGWRGAHHLGCGAETLGHDWTRIAEAGRAICRFDSRSWIHEVSAPTTVIATSADDVVPPRRQLALADAIPNATVRIVAGGHSVCTTHPHRFVPALVDACTEVATRAAARRSVELAA